MNNYDDNEELTLVSSQELCEKYSENSFASNIRNELLWQNSSSKTWVIRNRISYWIKECGLKQNDVANKIGISTPQMQKICSNRGNVSIELLCCIARVLMDAGAEIDIEDLLVLPSEFNTKQRKLKKKLIKIKEIIDND